MRLHSLGPPCFSPSPRRTPIPQTALPTPRTFSRPPAFAPGNPQDPDYWRRKGDAHAQARNAAFAGSQAAFHRGDHGEAGRLSRQGKQHDAQCKECNAKASQLAFDTNNRGRGLGEVDLHGLRVAEAEEAAERAIRRAKEVSVPGASVFYSVLYGMQPAPGGPSLPATVARISIPTLIPAALHACLRPRPSPAAQLLQQRRACLWHFGSTTA